VLAYPDFQLPFILTTDGSKTAVAAILLQLQEGVERPISFFFQAIEQSRKLLLSFRGRNVGIGVGYEVLSLLLPVW
jgi:hypothetical protein